MIMHRYEHRSSHRESAHSHVKQFGQLRVQDLKDLKEVALETSTCAGSEASLASDTSTHHESDEFSTGVATSVSIQRKTLTEMGWEVQGELGHGNQSSVHLVQKASEGTFRCVKRFHRRAMDRIALENMMQEYQTMKLVERHPQVGKTFGLFQDSEFFHLEMEFYEGGDFTTLKQRAAFFCPGVSATEDWWGKVFKQCLEGLRHVHSNGMIHCDIKEQNLMLRTRNYAEPSVVIIDFGVAQPVGVKRDITYGTPGYIAPEVWRTLTWDTSGDMFSLGVVILQMMIGRTPTEEDPGCGIFVNNEGQKEVARATNMQEAPIHEMPSSYPNLKSLVGRLLVKDPSQRPSAQDALCDDWIDGLKVVGNDKVGTVVESRGEEISKMPKNSAGDDNDSWFPTMAAGSILPVLLMILL